MTFVAHGATGLPVGDGALSPSDVAMRLIHASSSCVVRALVVGNAPMMPLRHAAMTRSGPDMRNMGAATTGRRKRPPAVRAGASAPMFKFVVTC